MTHYALVSCPFCGGADCGVLQNLDGLHAGACRACEAQGPPKPTIGEAIMAWNGRWATDGDGVDAPGDGG